MLTSLILGKIILSFSIQGLNNFRLAFAKTKSLKSQAAQFDKQVVALLQWSAACQVQSTVK